MTLDDFDGLLDWPGHADLDRERIRVGVELMVSRRAPVDRQHLEARVQFVEGHDAPRRLGFPELGRDFLKIKIVG